MSTKSPKSVKKPSIKCENFDDNGEYSFKCDVSIGPNNVSTIHFRFKKPEEREVVLFDDVLYAAHDEMEKQYPSEYYPKSELVGYIYIKHGREWYPVIGDDENEIKKLENEIKSHTITRFLSLPYARYSLTPEYEAYVKLVESGMVDASKVPFDYNKMHSIVGDKSNGR